MALELFHDMASRVPAYKDFLKKNKIKSEYIQSIKDLGNVPLVDKDNYLRAYPRRSLVPDGAFGDTSWVISTTSGSTGEPFYFPRTDKQDRQYELTAEMYLRTNFQAHKKTILYINGFAMGAWIGGLFTYQAIRSVAIRNPPYRISIISPGVIKSEMIKAVRNLGPEYDRILIGGYPPLVKDMIDDAIDDGLVWKDYPVGFIFSAEGFSEDFRDYIAKKTGLRNVYRDTLNHYGTVDLGTMAHETPLSILIRRLLRGNPRAGEALFGRQDVQPTIAQYNPEQFYFQQEQNNLVCSAYSGIPLVRYDLKDIGGVYAFSELGDRLSDLGVSLSAEIDRVKLDDTVWQLPFVYVHERRDFVVKLYGANIYPETIRKALQKHGLYPLLTGKFTLQIRYDDKQNQFLQVYIELRPKTDKNISLATRIKRAMITELLADNSEYRSNYSAAPKRQEPVIELCMYGQAPYFASGGKQKWILT